MDFFGARYFSGPQGRFTSPDPFGGGAARFDDPQSWNSYAYARNNPLLYVDSDGRNYWVCGANICESAIIESGQNPRPDHNRLEFPIYGCAEYFNKAGWKIARLSQRCRDFIESMQPYHAPELQPGLMVFNVHRNLAILNDWARKDRHRALHVMGCWAFGASPKLRLPAGATLKYLRATGDGFLDERRDIATFAIEGYIRGMNVQANPAPDPSRSAG